MTTMTHDIIAEFTRSMADSADELCRRRGLARVFVWPFIVLRGERHSREAIRAMRAAHSLCARACESGACMAEVYQATRLIRDNYIKIAEGMRELPMPGFIKRRVNESLAEWDELAEDCAVGGDEEIRRTLQAIGSRL